MSLFSKIVIQGAQSRLWSKPQVFSEEFQEKLRAFSFQQELDVLEPQAKLETLEKKLDQIEKVKEKVDEELKDARDKADIEAADHLISKNSKLREADLLSRAHYSYALYLELFIKNLSNPDDKMQSFDDYIAEFKEEVNKLLDEVGDGQQGLSDEERIKLISPATDFLSSKKNEIEEFKKFEGVREIQMASVIEEIQPVLNEMNNAPIHNEAKRYREECDEADKWIRENGEFNKASKQLDQSSSQYKRIPKDQLGKVKYELNQIIDKLKNGETNLNLGVSEQVLFSSLTFRQKANYFFRGLASVFAGLFRKSTSENQPTIENPSINSVSEDQGGAQDGPQASSSHAQHLGFLLKGNADLSPERKELEVTEGEDLTSAPQDEEVVVAKREEKQKNKKTQANAKFEEVISKYTYGKK